MKRILFYTYEYPPLGGGIANAVWYLMRAFASYNKKTGDRSHSEEVYIDIITSSLDNTWSTEQLSPNITMYRVPIGNKRDSLHKQTPLNMIVYMLFSAVKTIQLLFMNSTPRQQDVPRRYDLAHVFGYPGAFVSFLFSWKLPYIVSLRGVDVPGYNPRFKLAYYLYRPLVRLTWNRAKTVIANSSLFADMARYTAPKLDIAVIPNGVDTTQFRPVAQNKKYPVFTITAGGTIMGPKKGLHYLVSGYAAFCKTYPDTRLMLIGSGMLENELKKQVAQLGIAKNVEFVGRKDKDWISRELPRCQVFCLPSLNEGMSNATLEALACGLPVVVTDVGGSTELVQGNGFIIPKRNSEAITEKLTTLYQDAKLRRTMSEKSRHRAEGFTWDRVARDYYLIYAG